MLRTTLLIIIKTPYAVAPVIAMVLNMILPVDRDDDIPAAASKPAAAETAEA
jgi:hypothetical protein